MHPVMKQPPRQPRAESRSALSCAVPAALLVARIAVFPGDPMSLDPQAQAMLAAYSGMPAIDFAQLTAPVYRAMIAAGGGFAAGDQIAGEEDWIIPASGGPLAARLYRPTGDGPFPLT